MTVRELRDWLRGKRGDADVLSLIAVKYEEVANDGIFVRLEWLECKDKLGHLVGSVLGPTGDVLVLGLSLTDADMIAEEADDDPA